MQLYITEARTHRKNNLSVKTTFPDELNIVIVYSLSSGGYQNIFSFRKTVLGMQSLEPEKKVARIMGQITKDCSRFLAFEQQTSNIKA